MWIALFFLPGILIIFSRSFRNKGTSELAAYTMAISISFFIVFPWFARTLNVSALGSSYIVFISTIFFLFFNIKKLDASHHHFDKNEILILSLFIAVLVLRCAPLALQVAPAGAEMSSQAATTRNILENDGVSSIAPDKCGLATVAAEVSMLGNTPINTSTLIVACLAQVFFVFGLYLILIRYFDKVPSAASAILASFLMLGPQSQIGTGEAHLVLASFLVMAAFSLIIESNDGPGRRSILASLCLSASLLTDPGIFLYGIVMIACYFLFAYKHYRASFPVITNLLLFTLLFSSPFVTRIAFTGPWVSVSRNFLSNIIIEMPYIILSLIGLVALLIKRRSLALIFLGILAVISANIILIAFHISFIHPTVGIIMLMIPIAIFSAEIMPKILLSKKSIALLSMVASIYYLVFYVYGSVSMSTVTKFDLDAFSWIDKTIGKQAVFLVNAGDGGQWIPALTGRQIISDMNGSGSQKTLKASYIYIGDKAIGEDEYKVKDLEKSPWKYKRVFSNGSSQVWKVL
jgi:hypothetical protein